MSNKDILKDMQVVRRPEGSNECEHDFAFYPSFGMVERIAKCRKCKLEAVLIINKED